MQKDPSELLSALDSLCLYRIEDWWTYELCYKKHVRQFHKVCTHSHQPPLHGECRRWVIHKV